MNLVRVAYAYVRHSPLATVLNLALLTLGVATITLLLLLSDALDERLKRDAAAIDLVVGAKGSPLQLVLAGVYHVDVPPGNIPLAEVEKLRGNALIRQVVPVAMGDSYRGFHIVGTEPGFLGLYDARLAGGVLWSAPLEAVLGAEVARRSGLALGAQFAGSHGLAEGGEAHGDNPYRVVGILAPSGTVIDRLVLTGVDSVWKVHEHEEKEERAREGAAGADQAGAGKAHAEKPAVAPGREVTMALVRYATPLAAASLPRQINSESSLQSASPAYESARLFTVFGVGTDVIRGFALFLIAAAALGMFIALYQAMDARQYDLAIMRTLGASRGRVCGVLLLESLLLAAAGAVLGVALGHALLAAVGAWLPAAATLATGASRFLPGELGVVALALAAGILAALLPAWRAYRLDVAATLAKG
ncbi:MAG TPA: ABC transporter permease [Casimicrobiaceae bacterium]|jgi:putative ABC transport system permease protein|nr:ABC transporter permease [Casimicrobiaceae bacterium]